MAILVTNDSSYFGFRIAKSLALEHQEVVLYGNNKYSLETLKHSNELAETSVQFVAGELCNKKLLCRILENDGIEAVIHPVVFKEKNAGEGNAITSHVNNVYESLCLIESMAAAGIHRLIFHPLGPMPYDYDVSVKDSYSRSYNISSVVVERSLHRLAQEDERWSVAILRNFEKIKDDADKCSSDYLNLSRKYMKIIGSLNVRSGIDVWQMSTGRDCLPLKCPSGNMRAGLIAT